MRLDLAIAAAAINQENIFSFFLCSSNRNFLTIAFRAITPTVTDPAFISSKLQPFDHRQTRAIEILFRTHAGMRPHVARSQRKPCVVHAAVTWLQPRTLWSHEGHDRRCASTARRAASVHAAQTYVEAHVTFSDCLSNALIIRALQFSQEFWVRTIF